ncbi:MAG TPA: DUF6580 family putative transport protein [Opitutaceae bacterium]|nr:DUF6580 family putative transport protein [Opitutaceae bacterium]
MNSPRTSVLIITILAAAALRLVPHAPNVTPIAALALFGGAQLKDRRLAFGLPLAAMMLSDLVLGFHSAMWAVYGCFALTVSLGLALRSRRGPGAIVAAALASSVVFFVVTNFAVWAMGGMYAPTTAGLVECYAAAVPFFHNEVLGDLLYTAVLFGGFALAEERWPVLARPEAA